MPEDNDSPLKTSMIALHEMYLGLREGGFTRSEAMELISKTMVAGMNQANPGGEQ